MVGRLVLDTIKVTIYNGMFKTRACNIAATTESMIIS